MSKPMISSLMCECKTTVANIFPLRKPSGKKVFRIAVHQMPEVNISRAAGL
jgi:hypothetical protein